MELVDLPIAQLLPAPWNANQMDGTMTVRLMESLRRYGLVHNLVVRPVGTLAFEILSGNQRLAALRELGYTRVPCVVVDVDDAHARLLAQALNQIQGQDDLGLRAELLQEVLDKVDQDQVLALLPETAESLHAMTSLGQQDMATYLQNWQKAQAARLKHLQLQLTASQLPVVEKALAYFLPGAHQVQEAQGSPNTRGTALYLLCKAYLALSKEAT